MMSDRESKHDRFEGPVDEETAAMFIQYNAKRAEG
jgi:hypothetical protein